MFNLLFILMIIFCFMISFSVNYWFVIWLLIELNLLSFIPIMMSKENIKFSVLNLIQYYLIQSFSSILFLLSFMLINMGISLLMNYLVILMFLISLMIKLGMFPFYNWYMSLMMNLEWMQCFLLSILQKLIPLGILMKLDINNLILLMILLLNLIMSTVGGLNQTNLKVLMTFSSLNNLSWIILSFKIIEKVLYFYYMIYLLINLGLMYLFSMFKVSMVSDLHTKVMNLSLKMMIMYLMICLAGLPPMLGFLLKWICSFIINYSSYFTFILIIFMIMATLTLFYYLYLIIPISMFFKNLFKFKFMNKNQIDLFITFLIYFIIWSLMFNYIFN